VSVPRNQQIHYLFFFATLFFAGAFFFGPAAAFFAAGFPAGLTDRHFDFSGADTSILG